MSWFSKLLPAKINTRNISKTSMPEGLWSKCSECREFLFRSELERNLYVCPKCGYHMNVSARARLECFLDTGSSHEIAANLAPVDLLKFKDTKRYKDRILAAQKKTKEKDAMIVMSGQLEGLELVACAFEFNFIGGSMGTVVGEKFVRAVRVALNDAVPLVCFSASGGARMQESLFSLMQMAKTSAALAKLSQAKLPYISVMVNPCMGGVSASLATLGDINIAEPNALIGFAGPRVIEQTVREKLPEGFQRSEFLLERGAIDRIVPRNSLRKEIFKILKHLIWSTC